MQESLVESAGHESPDKEPKSTVTPPPRSPWVYASEGLQLALTFLVVLFAGHEMDAHWRTDPWFTVGGAALGLTLGLYNFIRRVTRD